MSEFDGKQAIEFAMAGKPDEFANTIRDSLADRILNSIEAQRTETAAKVFGTPEYFEAHADEYEEVIDTDDIPEEE